MMTAKPTWLHIPEWLIDDVWHFPYAYDTFKKYIPPGSLSLEVGFGSGRIMARVARELECTCVGVDPDDSAFSSLAYFSRQHGVKTEPVKGSGFCLPFKDNSFDVVYSEGVIEHFPVHQSEAMLAEHARVCREGGVVIVSVPNKFAVFHSLTKLLLGERFMFYPEASLSAFQLCGLMTRVGLTPERRNGFAFGCQFYMFQSLFLDQALPPKPKRLGLRLLSWLRGTALYHFDSPGINALIGFQTLAVARK
ncbi:MAG: class I SAM-dependent methyltransferase [Chloroflexota bacterium]|nr:class I SAM-dependent methyltransferase [Chloroflexota bacterium]